MKKLMSIAMCIVIMLSFVMPACGSEGTIKAVFAEGFDSYATNAMADSMDITGTQSFVKEYEPGNKGLEILTALGTCKLSTEAIVLGEFFVSFVISSTDKMSVTLNGNHTDGSISLFSADNSTLYTYNGKNVAGIPTAKTVYTVCADTVNSDYSIYSGNKCLLSDYYLSGIGGKEFNSFDITVSSTTGATVIIDNIIIGTGNPKGVPDIATAAGVSLAEYNAEVAKEYDPADSIREEVYFNYGCSFVKGFSTTHGAKGNTIELVNDTDGNGVVHMKRTTASDFHLDINIADYPSSMVVYEYDIKLLTEDCAVSNVFKSSDAVFWTPFKISGGILAAGDSTAKINSDEWYTVSMVYDTLNNKCDVYLNYEKVASDIACSDSYYHSNSSVWRLHVNRTSGTDEFMVDNIASYGGSVPREDIGEADIIITDDTAYTKDITQRNILKNVVSYHLRSGVVYCGGSKFVEKPVVENGVSYVRPEFFAKAFRSDVSTDSASGTATVNGVVFTAGSDVAVSSSGSLDLGAAPVIIGTKLYLPLRDVCSKVLRKAVVYNGDAEISAGMVLISDTPFTADESMDIQKLNDFALYERPDAGKILADYESSPVKGAHPRIMADKADFDRIRALMLTDDTMSRWAKSVINAADGYVRNPDPLIYELRDGVRLWYVSQDMIAHMINLGMAYQLTGDRKYAERAWIDLESVSNFPSWHPEHHIDVGGMAIGVAIGYDWMYDAFTPEQRAVIEEGARINGIYEYAEGYQGRSADMMSGVLATNNHNQVMNAGGTAIGLAFMDVYPDESAYCVAQSVRCLEFAVSGFAPEGSWYEGIGYAAMTLEYLCYQLASLENVFGTVYSLDATQGVDMVPLYYLYMQSNMGAFAFGDGASSSTNFDPGTLWLCNRFENYDALSALCNMFEVPGSARSILWYNPEKISGAGALSLDKAYASEQLWLMRDTWDKNAQNTFAGLKGGAANHGHAHGDIGKFEFFANGVQWTKDLGNDNYNLPDYWNWHAGTDNGPGGKRWKIWRLRGESHNTLIVNPDSLFEFDPFASAELIRTETKPRGSVAVLDTTSIHRGKAQSAQRGVYLADERRSLVVRDEVTVATPGKIYWHMITGQNAKLSEDGKSVIISQKENPENYVTLEFICDADYELTIGPGRLLPDSPSVDGMKVDDDICQIRLEVNATDSANITAKLTPSTVENGSDISEFDMPIFEWSIPDGEIPEPPILDSLVIDGVEYNPNTKIINHYVSQFRSDIPAVKAISSKYDVSVDAASHFGDVTRITVSDRENPNNISTYRVTFTVLKSAGIVTLEEKEIVSVTASAEPQPENSVKNVLDRDLNTRWSAEGGQYLIVDLGKDTVVDTVVLAFMNGDSRKYNTKISVSSDNINYKEVFVGTSGGETNGYELFNIAANTCRYVKLDFAGYNNGTWNSITEVAIGKRK